MPPLFKHRDFISVIRTLFEAMGKVVYPKRGHFRGYCKESNSSTDLVIGCFCGKRFKHLLTSDLRVRVLDAALVASACYRSSTRHPALQRSPITSRHPHVWWRLGAILPTPATS
jgi:hypothetical protein